MVNAAYEIERLLGFGLKWGLIEKWDLAPVRNQLLELLQLPEPYEGVVAGEAPDSPVGILENMLDYAAQEGFLAENTVTYRDLFDTRIMGMLMPRQSEVVRNFYNTAREQSIVKATDDYYQTSIKSNYIRMDRIEKNLYWLTPTEYGEIEITVNLSKPEKDPKAIAAARNMKQSNYPKCLLCAENAGYPGRINHPARQNHRIIPLELTGEQWFLQYSPYVYYNEHCIVLSEKHTPMKMSETTFARLLDFVELLPHYFLGSNADLPIVGGSILSHDHFQGGRHRFPMEKAGLEESFYNRAFPGVKAGTVKWPMSVVRLTGWDKGELVQAAASMLEQWRGYSDPEARILAFTGESGAKTPHNTITPIARRNRAGEFELDLVLRNNRTSAEHPDGIFHPHQELHHIKKENIGLIEVMGLAVLPGRLDEETKAVEPFLTGERAFNETELAGDDMLEKHLPWIKEMLARHGTGNTGAAVRDIIRGEIGNIFIRVLEDAGVYKRNKAGKEAFVRFLNHAGYIAADGGKRPGEVSSKMGRHVSE